MSNARRDWSTCSFARATPSDAHRVADLLVDAYQTWTAVGLNPKAAKYTRDDVEADLRSKEVWLLEHEGRLLGTATLKQWGQGANRYIYVTHVATPTSLQGQGIGTEVMRRIEADVKGRAVAQLQLDTAIEKKDLVKFYVDRGFVAFGEPFKWSVMNTYRSQKYRKNLDS